MEARKNSCLSVMVTQGASGHFAPCAELDYYATDPKALELLLDLETFNKNVWEPACGELHLANVLEKRGYNVRASDLVSRKYPVEELDFLTYNGAFDGDIITNPPYSKALEFVEHALQVIPSGNRAAFLLKIQFLEGIRRRAFFEKHPPKCIYTSSARIACAKNGDFERYQQSSALCYAWYIWEKGFTGEPKVRWFN